MERWKRNEKVMKRNEGEGRHAEHNGRSAKIMKGKEGREDRRKKAREMKGGMAAGSEME